MKWLIFLAVLTAACNNNKENTTTLTTDTSKASSAAKVIDTIAKPVNTAELLIIPGESIGKVKLYEDAAALKILGDPDLSDAAMGKAWLTWKGKPDEHNNTPVLNVYTTYKDSTMMKKTVQQIRSTSSDFITQNNIHVYSSFQEIKQVFPTIKKLASYNDDGRSIIIYDAVQEGIAFEIAQANDQQICTGIIVHEKNKKVTEVYIMLHPEMKKY